ncbi:MAG: 4-(cytidine 5'-diphospho)-2-C-methyl-D-erythritol kinase [Helicobacteraceae bacterium]|jgi:4-diphosphocytidyl-2-C-methyl-D-erythritol kinase|nr:4-(cytidine 5'-diphospho)-2-C-methyl-D-erythritol kinase [Helicobacteraceae bacterium]
MTQVYTANAKINVFLKLIGRKENGYHLIVSRFLLIESLCDKLWFEKAGRNGFEVIGDFGCAPSSNTIVRAMNALGNLYPSKKLFDFASAHRVVVYKQIPSGAGLGGASSDAATFLRMINEHARLRLDKEALMKVGLEVGADVPFFISGETSANVRGVGEEIEPFDDKPIDVELKLIPICCETPKVYRSFRQHFSDQMSLNANLADRLAMMSSIEALRSFYPEELNDLLLPALKSYPELFEFREEGWFFSGSGSSFFRIRQ